MPRSESTVKRAKAIRYARIRAETGCTALAAWRQITKGWRKQAPQTQHNLSSEWSHDPTVIAELNKAVDALNVTSIDSIGRFHLHTVSREEEAALAGNWNAAMGYNRQRGQSLGALTERVTMTVDHTVQAGKLVQELIQLGIPVEAAQALMPRTGFAQIEDKTNG